MRNPKSKLDESALPYASIPQLHAALLARDIKPSELVRFFTRRLKDLGPSLNAVATLTTNRAKDDAFDIDYAYERGRAKGILQGIPYGAKDLLAAEGYPTTWGAKAFEDQKFERDAKVIDKLDSADAILVAKLAMVELAGGGGYDSAAASLQGPGLNPWKMQHWSGGSSSGSAAAVAVGLVPFALGSETSGSILTPACFCGVTGLRPTYGLVSRNGAMALSWTLDKIGVLARTAEDCGLVLHAIGGGDSDDPGSAGKSFYYTPNWYQKVQDLKIAYAETDWNEWPDEPMRPALREALTVVKSLGPKMVESHLPDFPYSTVIGTIIDSEAVSIFERFIRSGEVDKLADTGQIAGLKAALNYSALDYLKAMRVRTEIQREFRKMFADVDLLVAPTRFSLPDRADRPFDENEPKRPLTRGVGGGLIQAGNLCGLPALNLPCGFVDGLPVGLQIVGPPFTENRLFAFARAFQAASNYHLQHPKDPVT